jgi:hypothetical protein
LRTFLHGRMMSAPAAAPPARTRGATWRRRRTSSSRRSGSRVCADDGQRRGAYPFAMRARKKCEPFNRGRALPCCSVRRCFRTPKLRRRSRAAVAAARTRSGATAAGDTRAGSMACHERTAELGLTPTARADEAAPSPEAREADARPLPAEEEEEAQRGSGAPAEEESARCPATPVTAPHAAAAPATTFAAGDAHTTPPRPRAARTGACLALRALHTPCEAAARARREARTAAPRPPGPRRAVPGRVPLWSQMPARQSSQRPRPSPRTLTPLPSPCTPASCRPGRRRGRRDGGQLPWIHS